MSSTYNHLRQGRDKGIDELKFFIRTEVELQERLEATGYRPPLSNQLISCPVSFLYRTRYAYGDELVSVPSP